MKKALMDELAKMTDEDFQELALNIPISSDIRDLIFEGVDPEEIADRLDIPVEQLVDVMCGAFEFTTRHMAALKVLREEVDEFGPEDVNEMNSDLADREINDSDVVYFDPPKDDPIPGEEVDHDRSEEVSDQELPFPKLEPAQSYHEKTYGKSFNNPRTYTPSKTAAEVEFESLMNKVHTDYQKKKEEEKKNATEANPEGNEFLDAAPIN
jgi:hypothetical protein